MTFSKSFPKTVKGRTYPEWEEIILTQEEELQEESNARINNLKIMDQCIEDSKKIFNRKQLKTYQTDLINTSIALFEKRASHEIYWKENKAKEKFDNKYK